MAMCVCVCVVVCNRLVQVVVAIRRNIDYSDSIGAAGAHWRGEVCLGSPMGSSFHSYRGSTPNARQLPGSTR